MQYATLFNGKGEAMAQEATINARLDESLKRGGSAVLERNGVSPTQLIRSLYRYLEEEQRIPECLDVQAEDARSRAQRKREVARSIAGCITLPADFDVKDARAARIAQKYGDLL